MRYLFILVLAAAGSLTNCQMCTLYFIYILCFDLQTCKKTECAVSYTNMQIIGWSSWLCVCLISHRNTDMPSVLWHCWFGIRKSIQPVKNWVLRCWCGYLCGARCRLFAYGPADATAIPKPHHLLLHLNPDWFYLFGTSLPRLSWKRGH